MCVCVCVCVVYIDIYISLFIVVVVCYMGQCMYIFIDLSVCMNTNVHVCPYLRAYNAVVCSLAYVQHCEDTVSVELCYIN